MDPTTGPLGADGQPLPNRPLLTVGEVAAYFGEDPRTTTQRIDRGDLGEVVRSPGKVKPRRRVYRAAVLASVPTGSTT